MSDTPLLPARTRYAPSPTGKPHVGNIRNAIMSYLIARHSGGQFVLRIEDTDRTRLVPGAEEAIYDSLRWLGLSWDEGPDRGGPYGPYKQSERLAIYRAESERLVAQGDAYYCYCSAERLAALRAEQEQAGTVPGYDRRCRWLTDAERANLAAQYPNPVIRFAMPREGTTTFHDHIRGDITIANALLEDFIILKSDNFPTYHLAHLVDDHYMHITHVVRSEEWLPSAPLHTNLHRALGWIAPIYLHPALILGEDGKKLSKRNGDTYVGDYRTQGYISEAMLNFLVLLGWAYNDHDEIFSRDELIKIYNLDKIQPTPARFAKAKLDWMNKQYLNRITGVTQIIEEATPFLIAANLFPDAAAVQANRAKLAEIVPLVREKLKSLADLPHEIDIFFSDVQVDPGLFTLKDASPTQALTVLAEAQTTIAAIPSGDFSLTTLNTALRALAERLGLKVGDVFTPLRIALAGRTVSPGVPEMIVGLGRAAALGRLRAAASALEAIAQPADALV